MAFDKPKTYRSEKYLAFVRTLPCCVCGSPYDTQPHHLFKAGISLKGDDLSCIPLCSGHHSVAHTAGQKTFQEKYHINFIEASRDTLMEYAKFLEQGDKYVREDG